MRFNGRNRASRKSLTHTRRKCPHCRACALEYYPQTDSFRCGGRYCHEPRTVCFEKALERYKYFGDLRSTLMASNAPATYPCPRCGVDQRLYGCFCFAKHAPQVPGVLTRTNLGRRCSSLTPFGALWWCMPMMPAAACQRPGCGGLRTPNQRVHADWLWVLSGSGKLRTHRFCQRHSDRLGEHGAQV